MAAAAAAFLAFAASARPAADDVSVRICLSREAACLPGTKTGPNFQILVAVQATLPPVLQPITVRIGLPEGLRWGSDAPDPSEDCTSTAQVVCTGGPSSMWFWDVVAERVGSYEITATVETTLPDPNLSNNTFTFRFEVEQPGSAVVASAVKLSPAKPKSGATVAATVRVTAGGAPVRPSGIACTGTVARTKLKGTPRAGSGTATCLYRTPKTAKGKTLRGTISFSAKGTKVARRFSARLG